MGYFCQACSHALALDVKVARRDTCDACGADLHCCLNCKFWDNRADRCREDITRWVRTRDRSNFCASFGYADTEKDGGEEIDDAKAKLAALFKNL